MNGIAFPEDPYWESTRLHFAEHPVTLLVSVYVRRDLWTVYWSEGCLLVVDNEGRARGEDWRMNALANVSADYPLDLIASIAGVQRQVVSPAEL